MEVLTGARRDYRAVSYALISCAGGTVLMRILMYFLPFPSATYGDSVAQTAVFAVMTQIVFFLAVPFSIYKFYGRRTVVQTLEFSSCTRSFRPYFLLAVPLGFCVFLMTIGVSSVWSVILAATGYNYVDSSPAMPESFPAGLFVAEILLTAALPAVCEEFAMRGGLLTVAKRTFGTVGCVIACGVAFGLFHQNIRQVFYTTLFGMLAAFLTLKLKSIYPAMIMHFVNNFSSVFFQYAGEYGFCGGSMYARLLSFASGRLWALILIFAAVAVAIAAIVVVMLYCKEKRVIDRKKAAIKDAAFDATNKRVVLMGEFDPQKIAELEMETEVYGKDYREAKYKPKARDIMIIIGVGVATLLITVFTYVWGFFY